MWWGGGYKVFFSSLSGDEMLDGWKDGMAEELLRVGVGISGV